MHWIEFNESDWHVMDVCHIYDNDDVFGVLAHKNNLLFDCLFSGCDLFHAIKCAAGLEPRDLLFIHCMI